MAAYMLLEPPALPPPPPPPPPPKAAQKVDPVEKPNPTYQLLAPTVIPDAIPMVEPEPYVQAPVEGVEGGVEGGIEGGVVGGEIGGQADGILGGEVGGTVGSIVPPDDGRVVVPRDATLRMHALSKTFPMYPENARIRGWEDDVVVRYVIGTDGKVKDVVILNGSSHKIFDEITLNAIRYWRFRPMIKDGKPVEVVHELTIRYRLNA